MTKLAPEWVRTSDPVIRSPARYRWTTASGQRILSVVIFLKITYTCRYSIANNVAYIVLQLDSWMITTMLKYRITRDVFISDHCVHS